METTTTAMANIRKGVVPASSYCYSFDSLPLSFPHPFSAALPSCPTSHSLFHGEAAVAAAAAASGSVDSNHPPPPQSGGGDWAMKMKSSSENAPDQPSDNSSASCDDLADECRRPLLLTQPQPRCGRKLDPDMDPKRLKRILSNRVSARKSRMKKFQYITDMERKVKALEAEITVMSPQLVFYERHNVSLKRENTLLTQRLSALTEENVIKDALVEQKKVEVRRLMQVYMMKQQQQQQQRQEEVKMLVWNDPGIGVDPCEK